MRKLVIATILLLPHAAFAADAGIDAFEAAQQAAWNAHDAAAYSAAFDLDAVVVTAQGWRWSGREDAVRNLTDGFKLVYARAQLTTSDIEARMLTPDLATVTLRWSIAGARAIDGGPATGEQSGVETQVLRRSGQGWAILVQQDTPAAASTTSSAGSVAEHATPTPQSFSTTPPPVRRCVLARGNGECLIYGKAKPTPAS